MAERDIHLTGTRELYEVLQTFPVELEKNVMRNAFRAGAKVALWSVRARLAKHTDTGETLRSLYITSRVGGGIVSSSVKARSFVARFLEYGTRPHMIAAKYGHWLSFNGAFLKAVSHPGARPYPFMRPALDSSAQDILNAVGNHVRSRLTTLGALKTPSTGAGE